MGSAIVDLEANLTHEERERAQKCADEIAVVLRKWKCQMVGAPFAVGDTLYTETHIMPVKRTDIILARR